MVKVTSDLTGADSTGRSGAVSVDAANVKGTNVISATAADEICHFQRAVALRHQPKPCTVLAFSRRS